MANTLATAFPVQSDGYQTVLWIGKTVHSMFAPDEGPEFSPGAPG